MTDENGNGERHRRKIDRETMERVAESSVVKLSARIAQIAIITIGLPVVGYLGHRMVTQLDLMADQQVRLSTSVAVIAAEIRGMDRRVRNLEWRRVDREDERPGVRQ